MLLQLEAACSFTQHSLPSFCCFPALPIFPSAKWTQQWISTTVQWHRKQKPSYPWWQAFSAAPKATNQMKHWLCWSHCRFYPNSSAESKGSLSLVGFGPPAISFPGLCHYKGTHRSLRHGQHVEKSVFFQGPCPVLQQDLFHCSNCCFEDEGEETASLLETVMQLSFPQLPDFGVN